MGDEANDSVASRQKKIRVVLTAERVLLVAAAAVPFGGRGGGPITALATAFREPDVALAAVPLLARPRRGVEVVLHVPVEGTH